MPPRRVWSDCTALFGRWHIAPLVSSFSSAPESALNSADHRNLTWSKRVSTLQFELAPYGVRTYCAPRLVTCAGCCCKSRLCRAARPSRRQGI